MSLVTVGVVFVIFIALALLAWIAVIIFTKDEDEDIDNPIGINFMAGNCDGRAIGIEKDVKLGNKNRRVVTLAARDVRIKDIKLMPEVPVIVEQNKTITIPKGSWSKDKNINIYLASSPDKYPEPLKQTEFGKILMLYTALKNSNNAEIEAFKEGMKSQAAHIKNMRAGEVSIEQMNQLREYFDEALDSIKESKKKEDTSSSGFAPPRFSSNVGGM